MSYLVAIHLYDRRPSTISTSKISHVTENRGLFWVKEEINHPACFQPAQKYIIFKMFESPGVGNNPQVTFTV